MGVRSSFTQFYGSSLNVNKWCSGSNLPITCDKTFYYFFIIIQVYESWKRDRECKDNHDDNHGYNNH